VEASPPKTHSDVGSPLTIQTLFDDPFVEGSGRDKTNRSIPFPTEDEAPSSGVEERVTPRGRAVSIPTTPTFDSRVDVVSVRFNVFNG